MRSYFYLQRRSSCGVCRLMVVRLHLLRTLEVSIHPTNTHISIELIVSFHIFIIYLSVE